MHSILIIPAKVITHHTHYTRECLVQNHIPAKLFVKKLLILTLAVLGPLQTLIRACAIYNYPKLRNITQIVWKIMLKEESLGIFDENQSKAINSTL